MKGGAVWKNSAGLARLSARAGGSVWVQLWCGFVARGELVACDERLGSGSARNCRTTNLDCRPSCFFDWHRQELIFWCGELGH